MPGQTAQNSQALASENSSLDRYLEDASGYRGEAERLVAPRNIDEIQTLLRHCGSQKIPLTISGAGTGLTGARVPRGGWVLSLENFRFCEVTPGRAHCGPALLLSDLDRIASQSRQFFGPNPTETSASIGGIVSTNAGGARSFRYGSVRRQIIGLEATFLSGETKSFRRGDKVDFAFRPIPFPATTKNSAGYLLQPDLDWIDLLAGSEGTLAVISAVDLVLYRDPPAILSGVVFFSSDDQAMDAVDCWRSIHELRLLEYMDNHALNLLRPHYAQIPAGSCAALMIEQNLSSTDDEQVDRWTERIDEAGGDSGASWFGFSAADQEQFRAFRHLLPAMVVESVRRHGFPKFGTDFAVPLDQGRTLHRFYRTECERSMPGKYTIFGHAGDANNHINLLPETPRDASVAADLIDECARYVLGLGGTIAAEHGIGKIKTDLLRMMYSPEEIACMRQVKLHLDRDDLLGRGTIFGN